MNFVLFMDPEILEFIREQKIFSLCTSSANTPYSAICYYAFDDERDTLLFCSESKTRHVRDAIMNSRVAGSIIELNSNGFTRGLQFTGTFKKATDTERKIYFQKYPLALALKGEVWMIELERVKMSSTNPVFRKKIQWERS